MSLLENDGVPLEFRSTLFSPITCVTYTYNEPVSTPITCVTNRIYCMITGMVMIYGRLVGNVLCRFFTIRRALVTNLLVLQIVRNYGLTIHNMIEKRAMDFPTVYVIVGHNKKKLVVASIFPHSCGVQDGVKSICNYSRPPNTKQLDGPKCVFQSNT